MSCPQHTLYYPGCPLCLSEDQFYERERNADRRHKEQMRAQAQREKERKRAQMQASMARSSAQRAERGYERRAGSGGGGGFDASEFKAIGALIALVVGALFALLAVQLFVPLLGLAAGAALVLIVVTRRNSSGLPTALSWLNRVPVLVLAELSALGFVVWLLTRNRGPFEDALLNQGAFLALALSACVGTAVWFQMRGADSAGAADEPNSPAEPLEN